MRRHVRLFPGVTAAAGGLTTAAAAVVLGLAVATAVVVARSAGHLEPFELATHDALLRLTTPEAGPDPRVLIVRIAEEDIQRHGQPLSDGTLARALGLLFADGARAVGIDLYRDRPIPPGSDLLEEMVFGGGYAVLIEKRTPEPEPPIPAPPFVAGTSRVGFSDLLTDRDGRVRRALLAMSVDGRNHLSLALRLARTAMPGDRFVGDLGGYADADDAGHQLLLHPGRRPEFERYGLSTLLAGELPEGTARDRVVLIGTEAPSLPDLHRTPFGTTHGVEVHAWITSELLARALDGAPGLRAPSETAESALVFALALGAALAGVGLRSVGRVSAVAALGLVAIVVGAGLGFREHVWLPLVPGALGWVGSAAGALALVAFRERSERDQLMTLFGRFQSPEVLSALWHQRDAFADGGRPRAQAVTITVLTCDLGGFSAAAEKLGPGLLMSWVNEYLDRMATVIRAHGGIVDDYAGDGIMANFGLPVPRAEEHEITADARAAVRCALAMCEAMAGLNRDWAARSLPEGRMRVGLCTGPAVVGMIGASDRLKYTSVGDTVNTSARLESYDREGFAAAAEAGGPLVRILAAESTVARLEVDRQGAIRRDGELRIEALGELALRGKSEPIRVFRIEAAPREDSR